MDAAIGRIRSDMCYDQHLRRVRTPSLWTAYTTPNLTGISSGTWWLVLGELTCWAIFGTYQRDVPLIVLGTSGILAAALMLQRAHTAARSRRVRTTARSR